MAGHGCVIDTGANKYEEKGALIGGLSNGHVARRRDTHIFFTIVSFVTDFVIRFWHPVLENRWNDILMVAGYGQDNQAWQERGRRFCDFDCA